MRAANSKSIYSYSKWVSITDCNQDPLVIAFQLAAGYKILIFCTAITAKWGNLWFDSYCVLAIDLPLEDPILQTGLQSVAGWSLSLLQQQWIC